MGYWMPGDIDGELRGQPLRCLLVTLLAEAGRPLTVQELIGRCSDEGVVFDGRPSKIISDALRWERMAGRVKHLRRGLYAFGRVPRSTRQWIRRRVAQARLWLAWSQGEGRGRPSLAGLERMAVADGPSWVPDWPWWPAPT